MVTDVNLDFTVVIISQYVQLSFQYTVSLKLVCCYMSIIAQCWNIEIILIMIEYFRILKFPDRTTSQGKTIIKDAGGKEEVKLPLIGDNMSSYIKN